MDIKEVLKSGSIEDKIKLLQSQRNTTDDGIELCKSALTPALHSITKRKKREVKTVSVNEDGTPSEATEYKEVNKIYFSYQADIVDKKVSFFLANPLQITTESDHKDADDIINAIKKIDRANKIDSINRKLCRSKFGYKEVAEYWFTVDAEPHNTYGFETDIKVKCVLFSPEKGDKLFPYFNEYGDLAAFSRGYIIKDAEGKEVEYFETWTDDGYYRWVNNSGWAELPNDPIDKYVKTLKKIPIGYTFQPVTEYDNVSVLCDRNEALASNHGDINDRHAKPILTATGAVVSKIDDFVQISEGGSLGYVSWNNATESINSEFQRNEDKIYSLSHCVKTSFESMKGMGNTLSGEGYKMLFIDMLADVANKMEDMHDYWSRRYNIVKAILASLNKKWAKSINDIDINITVSPYMIGAEKEHVEMVIQLYSANLISLETACKMIPMFEDALAEYEKIKAEQGLKDTSPNELDKLMNEK